ncbi:L-ribulose-5-phosphate 3-epimerase/hexulose-6-phosphate isomerase [Virgibacillus halotolerans]|uniref:L-ribulose-5-phosphate 3-epimerase n=1 Tax=Virgibacillus halotolerans TaxID=1071053 RepID=UPI00195FA6D6|nr:L-ribulose-5-phosphate 3-epimerase [Virgibacillus halotolerans]MBM7599106.1 L-ribulose-5-phosphate 3-epimerase/hexulose-6-phosphate isomerase [Virgibacillus halotolerans]
MTNIKIGVYEKALSDDTDLYQLLKAVEETRFDYLEISIDDSSDRLSRLEMSKCEREKLKVYMSEKELYIYSIVLSANRSFPLGSKDPNIRSRGKEIIQKAITFAFDLNIPVIQLAGYYTFFSDSRDGNERDRFIEGLKEVSDYAAWNGVMLGLENMDGKDILSIKDSINIIEDVKSPWLQLYPDIGNLVANGLSLTEELKNIVGRTLCIHLKDTRRDEFRRVPFGDGEVDFELAGDLLRKQGYRGNYTVEMWNDGDKNSLKILEETLNFLENKMRFQK